MENPRTGLPVSDVIALLRALGGADLAAAAAAVADMLHAAQRGKQIEIDTKHLGVDQRLLARVLEAAGAGRSLNPMTQSERTSA